MKKILLLSGLLLLSFTACTEEKIPKGTKAAEMKCGAGKCGASMFDDNDTLKETKETDSKSAMKCAVGKCG